MAEGGSHIWTPGGERRVGEPRPSEERELSPEELTELMRQLKISDFLLSNVSTLAQLAYAKLDRSSRDLAQARLAVDALRALLSVLEGTVPPEVLRDFGQVVSNLQLAYAGAVDEERGQEGQAGEAPSAEAAQEPSAGGEPGGDRSGETGSSPEAGAEGDGER